MKLQGNMKVENGRLTIAGADLRELADEYSTPLYIMDQAHFEAKARTFLDNFKSNLFEARVIYASKAFLNMYIAGLAESLGLFIDVVSGGELYTALEAEVDPKKIYFHGNNKTPDEIVMAITSKVGTIVVDGHMEGNFLIDFAKDLERDVDVLLRVNPEIEADTHKFIQTTKEDSKFGESIYEDKTMDLIKRLAEAENINFKGIHCHIGSQIFDEDSFFTEAKAMLAYAKEIEKNIGKQLEEVNLGGGFGVYYSQGDKPLDFESFLKKYIKLIEDEIQAQGLKLKTVSIEPGRSLINSAGSTLYTVGWIKEKENSNSFVFIDGGMTDNLRPALYDAVYEAALPERFEEKAEEAYKVAGKCCESGDILIQEAFLPRPNPGDLLLISGTGAYNYSMSSNYNRIVKPAVVFIKNGVATVAVEREDYSDLIRNDRKYNGGN